MQDINKLIQSSENLPSTIFIKTINENYSAEVKTDQESEENTDTKSRSDDIEDLTIEILKELEMIMHISTITCFFMEKNENEFTDKNIYEFEMTFKDFIKRCDKVCELTDNLRIKVLY